MRKGEALDDQLSGGGKSGVAHEGQKFEYVRPEAGDFNAVGKYVSVPHKEDDAMNSPLLLGFACRSLMQCCVSTGAQRGRQHQQIL